MTRNIDAMTDEGNPGKTRPTVMTGRKPIPGAGKLMAIGRLSALSGRVAYHIAKERITNPRPVTLREVPPTPGYSPMNG